MFYIRYVGLRGTNRYVKPLIDFGIIEMTLPDKPNSRFQKYRLTGKGRKLLQQSR